MAVGETEKLIVPVKDNLIRYYVKNNEICQILHDIHLCVGHGGRNRMEKDVKFRYKTLREPMRELRKKTQRSKKRISC